MAAALLLAIPPAQARANPLYLDSSMSAQCVGPGGSCSLVQFDLDVANDTYVDIVRIWSLDLDRWYFGSLVSVRDVNGNALDWTAEIDQLDFHLKLVAGGAYAPEPIIVTVEMSTYSTPDDLYTAVLGPDGRSYGTFVYNGEGSTLPGGEGDLTRFEGNVTPEPMSVVLLGSGLLGIAGAARRRRRFGSEV